MAITVEERNISQQGGDKRYTGYYLVKGTASFADARSELLSTIPLVEGSLIYQDCQLEPQYVDTLNPDKCIWYAEAQYGELGSQSPAKKLEIGDIRIQFDTTGGQTHVTSSRQVVAAFDDGTAGVIPDDCDKLIGVSPDGVSGADIGVTKFDFNVTAVYHPSKYPDLTALYNLGWHVNQAAFSVTDTHSGLTIATAAEECLFMGASGGATRQNGGMELAMRFSASPNETGLSVGAIGGITKKGHELLDVWYRPKEVTVLKIMGQKAVAAFVHRVYKKGDFSILNLDDVSGP